MNAMERVEQHVDYGKVRKTGVNRHSEDSYTDYYVGDTVVVRVRVTGSQAQVLEMSTKNAQKEIMARGSTEFCLQYLKQRYGIGVMEKCA